MALSKTLLLVRLVFAVLLVSSEALRNLAGTTTQTSNTDQFHGNDHGHGGHGNGGHGGHGNRGHGGHGGHGSAEQETDQYHDNGHGHGGHGHGGHVSAADETQTQN